MDRKTEFLCSIGQRQFRRILSEQSNERAMMYALARGREVDPVKIKSAAHLILTKDGAYWDLMG
jgi:hypothetical protein